LSGGETIRKLAGSLEGFFRGKIILDHPLAPYTTFRIGGPADLVAVPKGEEDLFLLARGVSEYGVDFVVLGGGSNVLVSDKGFRGVVIIVGEGLGRARILHKCLVKVEAGRKLGNLISWAAERGLGGIEDLAGIPGTVGGAVRVNAGAFGTEIGERVERVYLLEIGEAGEVHRRELVSRELGFSYRRSEIAENTVIYKVELNLYPDSRIKIDERRKEILERRRKHQPSGPSAGSVFRNPPGQAAGELIEKCGLKGKRRGGAVVSPLHGNFIINEGGASAEDVLRLMEEVKAEVRKRTGVELEEEIRLIGEWEGR
jgi:UDP-N-acetylmuramate dehydrogenase